MIYSADILLHMTVETSHLIDYILVGKLEICIHISLLIVPFLNVCHYALEVLHAVCACLHSIITEVFGLCLRVIVSAFASKPVTRTLLKLIDNHIVESQALVAFALRIREIAITPLYRPLVIVIDTREETSVCHSVFWLSHIVESGIVHDGSCVSMLFEPLFVAQFLHRGGMARTHIMTQSEGMTYLMR